MVIQHLLKIFIDCRLMADKIAVNYSVTFSVCNRQLSFQFLVNGHKGKWCTKWMFIVIFKWIARLSFLWQSLSLVCSIDSVPTEAYKGNRENFPRIMPHWGHRCSTSLAGSRRNGTQQQQNLNKRKEVIWGRYSLGLSQVRSRRLTYGRRHTQRR